MADLVLLNQKGYLTINSQPAVNGVSSTDKTHGWGDPHGYVYQKAYVEFFCSKERWQKLHAVLLQNQQQYAAITYIASNIKVIFFFFFSFFFFFFKFIYLFYLICFLFSGGLHLTPSKAA